MKSAMWILYTLNQENSAFVAAGMILVAGINLHSQSGARSPNFDLRVNSNHDLRLKLVLATLKIIQMSKSLTE
jgi:hypothetical protein